MAMTAYTPAQIAEAIHGDDEAEVKTRVTQSFKELLTKRARSLGYRSAADFVRDALHVAVLGAEVVEQCHASRRRGVGQPWANSGMDSGFGSAL